jgi:hypothetical protein
MKMRKLLQDVLGGALGLVGMIVSLARGDKPEVTSTAARGDTEKEKGKHVAIVRKKTAKKQETARKTAPAKAPKKAVRATPAKSAKKVAPAASSKGGQK